MNNGQAAADLDLHDLRLEAANVGVGLKGRLLHLHDAHHRVRVIGEDAHHGHHLSKQAGEPTSIKTGLLEGRLDAQLDPTAEVKERPQFFHAANPSSTPLGSSSLVTCTRRKGKKSKRESKGKEIKKTNKEDLKKWKEAGQP